MTASRAPADDTFETEAPSPGEVRRRRALGHYGLLLGGAVVLAAAVIAVFAPAIAPFDPYDQDLTRRLIAPIWGDGGGWVHVFGTDGLGRDYLSRVIHGTRISLTIGFFAALISALIGSTLGIVGGYFGGRVDALVMYLINVKLALPPILIALSLVTVVGGSVTALVLILGFLFWDRFAVVTRSVTQQIRANDYITAAEAVGASKARIIGTEVLPNVMNQIIVIASLEMALAILVEAVLSFLGLGVSSDTPTWGLILAEARSFITRAWWLGVFPGLAIMLTVLSINFLGDSLRDLLDVRETRDIP